MNGAMYKLYKDMMYRLKHFQKFEDELNEEDITIISDLKLSMEILDAKSPHYRNQYEREKAIIKSFTREQADFICWQIGDWYLEMKPLLEGQHNLGYMKEKLKEMIVGDGSD